MTDFIPIRGYATFDPLRHCWVGSGFEWEWFQDLEIAREDRIMSPLKRIAEETEEDYQRLCDILRSAGVTCHRSHLDMTRYSSLHDVWRPPVNPRDHFAVIGETLYATSEAQGYGDVLRRCDPRTVHIDTRSVPVSTAVLVRVGRDVWWDIPHDCDPAHAEEYVARWRDDGFRVHTSHRGYHSDAVFCVVRPGCIVSLMDIQDYHQEFPGWDVLYLPDQGHELMWPWQTMKSRVGRRWWLKGEDHNRQLINFVNTWLQDWVGYAEETVFDVNMLSIDHNTIICNNYNKEVFAHFRRHQVEPIIFNFRHRWFWDGGVHCITQDLYREGEQTDYFA